jgi:RNAse (barnase) inhibitor barstar
MAALAKALRLPETFGANLDALYDCLTDAAFSPQGVVVLEGLHDVSGMPQEDLLDVFADAVAQHSSDAPGLTVYWSC